MWYVEERGTLLAESFLLGLRPLELRVMQNSEAGFDYVAFFSKVDSAPVLVGVETKATEQEVDGGFPFQVAQLKGIKSRLVVFPEENHWILHAQNAQVWQHEFFKWLKETL